MKQAVSHSPFVHVGGNESQVEVNKLFLSNCVTSGFQLFLECGQKYYTKIPPSAESNLILINIAGFCSIVACTRTMPAFSRHKKSKLLGKNEPKNVQLVIVCKTKAHTVHGIR